MASFLARFALTFTGLALFLCLMAAVDLAVVLLYGIGALWLVVGVFVVAMLVLVRAEGL